VTVWYVYATSAKRPHKPKYLGFVKGKPRAALREAHERWPGQIVDLVDKQYIADKMTRTIKVPKKEK
jgi:hypothetical protein